MNISTDVLLKNKISNSPEELMITSLKEVVLAICDNPEIEFNKENEQSFSNVTTILLNFYRIFLAQIYMTESLPFNVLEFYSEFLKKHLEAANSDSYEARNYISYNINSTFKNHLTEFVNNHNRNLEIKNS